MFRLAASVAVAVLAASGCLQLADWPGTQGAPVPDPVAAVPSLEVHGPDAGAVSLQVSAGHARLQAPWAGIEVELFGPDAPRRYGPRDGEVTLGFLRSGTAYSFAARGVAPDGSAGEATGRFTTTQGAGWGDGSVRPGALVAANIAHCSLAFLLRDATNATLYALTAGHCVTLGGDLAILDDLQDVEPERVGSIVHIATRGPDGFGDWALARLDDGARPRVHPSTAHWSGPSAVFAAPAFGGPACHFGWGAAVGWANDSQPRCARWLGYASDAVGVLEFDGVVTNGDSGSPVVEHATGRAMGVIVRAEQGSEFGAVDLCHVLVRLHAAGYDLALATAPYHAAPPAPLSESPLDPVGGGGMPVRCPPHIQAGYWP